jgi:hypothetical protein
MGVETALRMKIFSDVRAAPGSSITRVNSDALFSDLFDL